MSLAKVTAGPLASNPITGRIVEVGYSLSEARVSFTVLGAPSDRPLADMLMLTGAGEPMVQGSGWYMQHDATKIIPDSYIITSSSQNINNAMGAGIASDGSILFSSWAGSGVHRSTNGGTSWANVLSIGYAASIFRAASGRVFVTATTQARVYYSDNNGASFSFFNLPLAYGHFMSQSSSGRIFVTSYNTDNKIAFSDNDGATWSVVSVSGPRSAITEASNGNLIACGWGSDTNLYVSSDGGLSWSANAQTFGTGARAFIRTSTGRLCALMDNNIRYSDNNGATWAASTMSAACSDSDYIGVSSIYEHSSGLLVALSKLSYTNGVIFISGDNGGTWEHSKTSSITNVNAIAVLGSGVIVASCSDGSVKTCTPKYL
jgi:photosystem II stability/assembly factor-like uncharacterized protein